MRCEQTSSGLRIFFSTILNLALLQMQNSPATSGLKQLHLRAFRIDKNGDPKKRYSPVQSPVSSIIKRDI